MPVIVDNNFTNDSHSMRADRLNAIQSSFSLIQPELNAPSHLEDWAEDCYDVFMEHWNDADREMFEHEGSTVDANNKGALMEEEYQNARNLAMTIVDEDDDDFKDYGFHLAFPQDRQKQVHRVQIVLDKHAQNFAEGFTNILPDVIITRLQDAKDAFVEALQKQRNENDEARHAVGDLNRRTAADNKKLQALKSWWFAMMGKKDERIGMIGMVNPDYSGSGGNQIAAPTNFRYDYAEVAIRWSAVSGATSYQVEFSEDNTNWEVIYEGPDTEFLTNPMLAEHTYLRARARNSNGFSAYTSTVNIVYDLTLPMAQNLTYLPAYPGFNWDVVPGAINYEVHLRNQSAPPDEWLKIYFGNDNTLYHADPLGSYVYRIRAWNNQGTSAWAELEYSVTP